MECSFRENNTVAAVLLLPALKVRQYKSFVDVLTDGFKYHFYLITQQLTIFSFNYQILRVKRKLKKPIFLEK